MESSDRERTGWWCSAGDKKSSVSLDCPSNEHTCGTEKGKGNEAKETMASLRTKREENEVETERGRKEER